MYRTARVAITSPEDRADVYLGGSDKDIPIIGFGAKGDAFEVQVNSLLLTVEQQATWLRDLAHRCESLAELLDAIDAPRIAREKASSDAVEALRAKLAGHAPILCGCGALELPDRYAVLPDPDESGVTHDRNWCGNRQAVAR